MSSTETRPRHFTILDGMALVAATALALAPAMWSQGPLKMRLDQVEWDRLHEASYRDSLRNQPTLVRGVLDRLAEMAIIFLTVFTPVIFVLRLLPPRPTPPDLARQPGLWATGGAIWGIIAIAWLGFQSPVVVPGAVAAAWLVLIVTKRWVAEPSWIDRAGRAIGICWLATLPFFLRMG
jgi:hypothetical protein